MKQEVGDNFGVYVLNSLLEGSTLPSLEAIILVKVVTYSVLSHDHYKVM